MAVHPIDRPIRDMAAALRQGSATAEGLIDEAIARHERFGGALNAYKHWDPERARQAARVADALLAAGHDTGPLMGLPVSVKDIYGVADMPIFAGTPKELPAKWRAEGQVVRAFRSAGAVITGKTHSVEFAFGGVGTNIHWDAPRNPWDGSAYRVSGGSSSGSGVSLAQAAAVLAMGTDTGGSGRIPASMTGQVGLKTSIGRWSTDGIVPLSASFDTPSLAARSVEDAIVGFAAIDPAHHDTEAAFQRLDGREAAGLRLAISDEHFWDECAPGIAEAVKAALDELTAKGAHLTRISLPEAGEARDRFMRGSFFGVEGLTVLEREFPEWFELLDPNIGVRFEVARQVKASDYVAERSAVDALARVVDDKLRHVDALVTPTVPIPPPTLDEVAAAKDYAKANGLVTRNTQPINLLALCAVTLPVALDRKGMPVGLQLVARHGAEEALLATALACEKALGRAPDRLGVPPLCRT